MIPAAAAKMKTSAPASPRVRFMKRRVPSVVFLVPDMFPVESHTLQNLPHIVDHRSETAKVNVDVVTSSSSLRQMRLHAAHAAFPSRLGPRERRPKTEL